MVEVTDADREAVRAYTRGRVPNVSPVPSFEDMLAEAFARHRQNAADYWYRQGKDDGHQAAVRAMVKWLQSDAWDGVVIEHAVDAIEAGEPFK